MHLLAHANFVPDLVTLGQLSSFLALPILFVDLLLEGFPHGSLLHFTLVSHHGRLVATISQNVAVALKLEKDVRLLEERASPSRLREDALELEELASSDLLALERFPRRFADNAPSVKMQAKGFRKRALELRTIADRREALQAQLEESLEELEELIAELRWPLLAR